MKIIPELRWWNYNNALSVGHTGHRPALHYRANYSTCNLLNGPAAASAFVTTLPRSSLRTAAPVSDASLSHDTLRGSLDFY